MTLQWVQEARFLGDACTEDAANRAKCKGIVIAALVASGELALLASGIPQAMVDSCVEELCSGGSAPAPSSGDTPIPSQERPRGNEPRSSEPRANPQRQNPSTAPPPVDQSLQEEPEKSYTLWWVLGGVAVVGGLVWFASRSGHLLPVGD